jgi:hypothetical protein
MEGVGDRIGDRIGRADIDIESLADVAEAAPQDHILEILGI